MSCNITDTTFLPTFSFVVMCDTKDEELSNQYFCGLPRGFSLPFFIYISTHLIPIRFAAKMIKLIQVLEMFFFCLLPIPIIWKTPIIPDLQVGNWKKRERYLILLKNGFRLFIHMLEFDCLRRVGRLG